MIAVDGAQSELLYDADDFRIRRAPAGDERLCFVTFSSLTDIPALDRPGFGETYFRERNIDAIHVINRTNVWYAYEDLPAALDRVRQAVAGKARVIAYGSSMGGYAAIRFAEALGAETAIAISPQYSIERRLVPFENRWNALFENSAKIRPQGPHGSGRVRPIVFYDPRDLDFLHFRLILANYPRTVGVAMPHSGHPAGAMLNETGVLTRVLEDIVADCFDADAIAATVRSKRRLSGQYLFTLARRLGPWHAAWKLSLAEAALDARREAPYLIYSAFLYEKKGDAKASETLLREAMAVLPDHPVTLRALAAFYLRAGRADAAVDYATSLCDVDPQERHMRLLAAALADAGRPDDARAAARRTSSLLLKASLSRPVAWRSGLLRHWRARPFGLEAQFDLVDEWRHRKRARLKRKPA